MTDTNKTEAPERIDVWASLLCRELRQKGRLIPYEMMMEVIQSAGTAPDLSRPAPVAPELTECPECGAPVSQDVHGQIEFNCPVPAPVTTAQAARVLLGASEDELTSLIIRAIAVSADDSKAVLRQYKGELRALAEQEQG